MVYAETNLKVPMWYRTDAGVNVKLPENEFSTVKNFHELSNIGQIQSTQHFQFKHPLHRHTTSVGFDSSHRSIFVTILTESMSSYMQA